MRTVFATAAAFAALAVAATPASAQTGEQIFRSILEGFLLPPPGQQQQQQQPSARFDVSDLTGRAACSLVFTGAGDNGTVQPQPGCPGALATTASWRRSGSDLELRNANNQILWRGQAHNDAWTGGAADTLHVYTVKPGAAVVGPTQPPAAQVPPAFTGEAIYGDWRAAEPGQTVGCRVIFVRPVSNNPFAVTNAVETSAGCPGRVTGATRWVFADNALTLTDNRGNPLGSFTRLNDDRWTGRSGDAQITLTRL